MNSNDELLAQLKGIAQHMRAAYSNLIGDAYFVDKAAAVIRSLQAELEVAQEKYRLLSAQHSRLCEQVYEEDGETLKIAAQQK